MELLILMNFPECLENNEWSGLVTVEDIRGIYSLYEENWQKNTLIKECAIDSLIRQPMNMMLLNGEIIDTDILNEAWRQIKKIEMATSEVEDDEEFLQKADEIYNHAKSCYQGYIGELFRMIIMKGVNDIIIQKFS